MATDITVSTTTYSDADRGWLLGEASGVPGRLGRTHGIIDYSKFTAGTHYQTTAGGDRYIKSGTVVAVVTSGGKIGPYDSSASDGRQLAANIAGFLFNNESVPADTAQVASVPIVDSFITVSESRLPANSGIATAVKTALTLVKFRA